MQFNGAVFTHPSYQMVTGWVPVCVFLLQKKTEHLFCLWFVFVWVCVHLSEGCVFWDFGLCQSFCCWSYVWAYTCTCVCMCVTNHCMIYTIFLCCCCLGPSVCHAYAQRSLCNWNGPLKAPCHMETSSLGCLYVHPSISFNCPELGFCAVTIYWVHPP